MFDVTVAPLVDLWGFDHIENEWAPPTYDRIDKVVFVMFGVLECSCIC